MTSIEDIVLQNDTRGISQLRGYLPANFIGTSADRVMEHKGKVLIVTGFYIAIAGAPETDGPPGAIAIGEGLKAQGFDVAYITDKWSKDVMEAIAGDTEVINFPIMSHYESSQFANELLNLHKPSLLISTERAGLVGDGTYRNWKGVDISEFNAKIDHIFDQHPESIGIGDGGNEIGMGNLKEVIPSMENLPDDPCVTTTSDLIIASCSNWGAYGLMAQISLIAGKNLLPSVERAYQWVKETVDAGAVEGMSGEKKDWVDGRSPTEDAVCLQDLHKLLENNGL